MPLVAAIVGLSVGFFAEPLNIAWPFAVLIAAAIIVPCYLLSR